MKKFLLTLVCAAAAWGASAAPQEVDFGKLPQKSQEFVQRYFSGEKVKRVEMDRDSSWDKYTVYFTNGNQVSFEGGTGDCTQIVMKEGYVPAAVLPEGVKSYIGRKYSNGRIKGYETTADGYKVCLTDNTCVHFDKNGDFVKATE